MGGGGSSILSNEQGVALRRADWREEEGESLKSPKRTACVGKGRGRKWTEQGHFIISPEGGRNERGRGRAPSGGKKPERPGSSPHSKKERRPGEVRETS